MHFSLLKIEGPRHRQIATEGALLGELAKRGLHERLAVVSADAGQFNVLRHALCWINAERLIHTLVPLNEDHRDDIAKVRAELWELYADLKTYKRRPAQTQACPEAALRCLVHAEDTLPNAQSAAATPA